MGISEYETIEKTLQGLSLPEEVVSWNIELGADWTDDPAAYVTLIIADDVWSDQWLIDVGRDLRDRVRTAVRTSGIPSWPYMSLMTASDFQELQTEKSTR